MFKSQAQRAKFAELVKEGKMSQDTFDVWQKATGAKKLPKRIGPAPRFKPITEVKLVKPSKVKNK